MDERDWITQSTNNITFNMDGLAYGLTHHYRDFHYFLGKLNQKKNKEKVAGGGGRKKKCNKRQFERVHLYLIKNTVHLYKCYGSCGKRNPHQHASLHQKKKKSFASKMFNLWGKLLTLVQMQAVQCQDMYSLYIFSRGCLKIQPEQDKRMMDRGMV